MHRKMKSTELPQVPGKHKPDTAESHLFSDSYCYTGKHRFPTRITLVRYNKEEVRETELSNDTPSFRSLVREDCVNWFRIRGLADEETITRLTREFDIHPLDLKVILTPCHAAKIDIFDKRLILVMQSCYFENPQKIDSEHICILARENLVFTFKEREGTMYGHVVESLQTNILHIREEDTGMLVAFILNSIFAVMISTAYQVEGILEKLDDIMLNARDNKIDIGSKIQECRHANLILQKSSKPLRNEFSKLWQSHLVQTEHHLLPVYNELYNELDYVVLTAENSKELLASMRDLYVSNNDLRTNTIMKRLTTVSTLFIPITFLVGLWGMNFRMPLFDWEYGYFIGWALLVLTAYGTWKYMKRNRWF